MKPKLLLRGLQAGDKPAAGYLLLGPEVFFRDRCLKALKKAVLGDDAGEDGLVEIDLRDQSLSRLLDETRTFSLFATSRLILGRNADGSLPRGRAKAGSDPADDLKDYFRDPTPGVTVVFECTRYDPADRDDKTKLERVAKMYASVPQVVELDRLTSSDALKGCALLADKMGLDIDRDALAELVEMLGADMARLENELVKLKLYKPDGPVTRQDLELMTPEARQSGAFELTDALARKDRGRALELIDTLSRTGAYWPMQITLLASLFRQALAVKELGGRNPRALAGELSRRGVRIWPSRAEQLAGMAAQFSRAGLQEALVALFEADRDLRRERPDDRLILEQLVLRLTA
ncbi:MAG: DNA polymerase III subunit delta [Acidobacteria bacterium]|nr:DNA polymerase III subunit delta [Acidobacteriota bacterium]